MESQLLADALCAQYQRAEVIRKFRERFATEIAQLPSGTAFPEVLKWLRGEEVEAAEWENLPRPVISAELYNVMAQLTQLRYQ